MDNCNNFGNDKHILVHISTKYCKCCGVYVTGPQASPVVLEYVFSSTQYLIVKYT